MKDIDHFFHEKLNELVNTRSCSTILDYGCGHGAKLIKLKDDIPHELNLYGVDYLSRFPADKRPSHEKISFIDKETADFKTLHETIQFDLIFSTFSLHHFEYPVTELQTIHSLLKPDGVLLIIDFNFENSSPALITKNIHSYTLEMFDAFRGKYHRHHYTLKQAEDLMRCAPFTIIESADTEYPVCSNEHEQQEMNASFAEHIEMHIPLLEKFDSTITADFLRPCMQYTHTLIKTYGMDLRAFYMIAEK